MTATLKDRFVAKVNKTSTCWLWVASCIRNGYGQIRTSVAGMELAHRVSYKLFIGPIPEGMYVCHKCDNPPCVNPEHLFLGTHLDNMRDMIGKGRYVNGKYVDGRYSTDKNAYNKAYREAHQAELAEYQRLYHIAHKKEHNARQRCYYLKKIQKKLDIQINLCYNVN